MDVEIYRFIFIALIFVLIATLQVYLCKRESRKAGLILPALSFGFSILAVIGIIIYSMLPNLASILFTAFQVLILMNIPTVILMGIYILYHGRRIEAT
jgi:hypothetical protein